MPMREVKITLYAQIGDDEPDPDSLTAIRRLIEVRPNRVEIYEVVDTEPCE